MYTINGLCKSDVFEYILTCVLRSNTSVEVIYGDNKRKQNPDDERLQLKSNGRDLGIAFNTNGIFDLDYGWLKNLRYTLAVNYMNKKSYEQRLLTKQHINIR